MPKNCQNISFFKPQSQLQIDCLCSDVQRSDSLTAHVRLISQMLQWFDMSNWRGCLTQLLHKRGKNKNHATEDRTSFMVSSLNTVLQEILVYRQEDTLLFFLHMQRHWVDYFLQACSVFRLETHVYHMANNYNLVSHIQLFLLYSASKDSYIYSYRYICWTFHAALSPPSPLLRQWQIFDDKEQLIKVLHLKLFKCNSEEDLFIN